MNYITKQQRIALLALATSLLACSTARADAVCDWNIKAGEFVVTGRMGAPPANRAVARAQTDV